MQREKSAVSMAHSDRVDSGDMSSLKSGDMSSFEKVSLASGRSSPVPGAAPADAQTEEAPAPVSTAAPPQQPDPAEEIQQAEAAPAPRRPASAADPLRELEEAAAAAAASTKEAAQQATQKLMKGAAEAKKELSSFMTSIWSAFDAPGAAAAKQAGSEDELRARLGLGEGEAVLESFRCKLIQQYDPVGNAFTPRKSIAFAGQLYITSACACFQLDAPGGGAAPPPVIKVPAAQIEGFAKEGDAIRLQLGGGGGAAMVLGGFALPKLEVDSALALLEHLTEAR
jgi:hypothetical protein